MSKVNLIEIANSCVNAYKESLEGNQFKVYVETLFFAITEDGRVSSSNKISILGSMNAVQCILVHERSEKATVYWYSWYTVEYIDVNGTVYKGSLGGDSKIYVNSFGQYDRQIMHFDYGNTSLYFGFMPWEKLVPKIWSLFLKIKDAKTDSQRYYLSHLFERDDKIKEMEATIDDLKQSIQKQTKCIEKCFTLLNEIKEENKLIDSKFSIEKQE